MTALRTGTLVTERRRWTPPLLSTGYDREIALRLGERRALALIADRRCRWPAGVASALSRLTAPINDVLVVAGLGPGSWAGAPTCGELLAAMARERSAFWGWDRAQWERVVAGCDVNVRQLVIAVAYGLCGLDDLHWGIRGFKCGLFARRVFGRGPVEESVAAVQAHLDQLGYAAQLRRPHLQRALFELMLAGRSPLLQDLAEPELLIELRAREQHNARRQGVEQLARTLVDMGLLVASPFAVVPSREEWLGRSRAGERDVPGVWLEWVKRWFVTSTLSRASRHGSYFSLVKLGRWLGETHPEHADPGSWTRELAAAWVARVDQLLVGEYSQAPNTDYMRRRSGGQLSPRTKAQLIWAPRRFFSDLQEWEWIARRFDPRRAFALPRSIRTLIGPDPRVISDEVWAKLMWAGLNLTADDLPLHANKGGTGTPWYPLELVRAVAMLWLFSGLRSDEIVRLRVGAIRWQHQPDAKDGNRRVCLLEVPTNKTSTAFTKPVDPLVGDAIEAWQNLRPPHPKFTDPKTNALVDILLAYRGARLGAKYVNRVLIPLLCRKAGVPREDVRGAITGHRARATIASQLYNAKDPMSLFELQAWLGHSSPHSTQHYARITPVTLTKAYTDAGYFERNVRAIEVLLDRDAITNGHAGTGGPFEFYDLGHGYCSYTFFEQCPHRMACARCDFYIPKQSSQAQLLEARTGLQRMLVQIPLTDEERAAVESDHNAVDRLLDRLTDTPTPAGPTPRDLDTADPGRVAPHIEHRNGGADDAS
jgi:integrase